MNTDDIYAKIKHQRENATSLNRFGCVLEYGELHTSNTICYADLKRPPYTKADVVWTCWNGESPDGASNSKYGRRDEPHHRRSEYRPGPISDKWLGFLLHPDLSPWRAIHGHLVTTDPVIIRESGLIFKDVQKIDFCLLFNFLIATRFCYEFHKQVEFWVDLVDNYGVDPRAAYLICIGYKKEIAGGKKPPLRKVLVTEAGYRKDAKGFRYIKDAWGDKKWFEAVYKEVDDHPDWKPGQWNGALTSLRSEAGHAPLDVPTYYERHILNGTWKPSNSTISDPPEYGIMAWSIFRTEGDPLTKPHEEFKTLAQVLEYFETFKGK